jgi:hypothetical protein
MLVDAYTCSRFDTRKSKESLMRFPKEFLVDTVFAIAHVFADDDAKDLCIVDQMHAEKKGYGRKCTSRVD